MNILIRAKRERVEHKFEDIVNQVTYCYWTGIHPKKAVEKVMFTDGKTVYGEGRVMNDADEDDGLCFFPLKRVNYPQPKKAPTRGFTYVET